MTQFAVDIKVDDGDIEELKRLSDKYFKHPLSLLGRRMGYECRINFQYLIADQVHAMTIDAIGKPNG